MDGWIRLDATKELPKEKGAIVSIGRLSRFASGLHLSCLFLFSEIAFNKYCTD